MFGSAPPPFALPGAAERTAVVMVGVLRGLTPAEVAFRRLWAAGRTWALGGAAHLITGGCADEVVRCPSLGEGWDFGDDAGMRPRCPGLTAVSL